MSWHYLREVAGESLEDICLGGEPLPPLKSKITHAEFYCKGKLMDSYLDSLSGMTFAPLMDTPGEEKSMSSAGVFPVRTSPLREKEMDSMVSGQDFGHKWRGWLARFDPLSCSLRTAQCSLLGEEHELLLTLPKWGMTVDGLLWELPMLEHLTKETECGLLERLPTPTSSDYKDQPTSKSWKAKGAINFKLSNPEIRAKWENKTPDNQTFFHTPNTTGMDGGSNSRKALKKRMDMLPTPNARDWKDSQTAGNRKSPGLGVVVHWPTPTTKGITGGSGGWDLLNKNTTVEEARLMGAGNGGQLNPPWVEWLMGWPIGWTDLKPLEMDKSPPVLPPLGDS